MNVVPVKKLFEMTKGDAGSFDDYSDVSDFGASTVAFVSASTTRNGVNGFVYPHQKDTVFPAETISVATKGQGSVSFSTVQPHPYVATALVLSLRPKPDVFTAFGLSVNLATLSVISACLRKQRWRFSFARDADESRVGELLIDIEKIKSVLNTLSIQRA